MGKKPRIDMSTKKAIAILLRRGIPCVEIMKRFNVSQPTVSVIKKNMDKVNYFVPKKVLGRRKVLNKREERLLLRYVRKNKFEPITQITENFSNIIQKTISPVIIVLNLFIS